VLMRVDHDGEGGILALLALASPPRILGVPVRAGWLVWVAAIGAGMLLGDGVITPAISVISAVEGLGVATSVLQPLIAPISVGLLLALFAIQSRGTERVGAMFGPVMAAWFLAIAASGIAAVWRAPAILAAVDPRAAIGFVAHHGVFGFLVFGAVVLCVTGVEALYADLSHFGRRPIATAWYAFVFPSLLCSYLGQGARLLADPSALASPFYALTPGWSLFPMIALATAATIIASQALISGTFTLTEQAVALNLCPRLLIKHTSRSLAGQVYVPAVNGMLAIGCTLLVFAFRSSDRLAAAYGLAVAGTMIATSIVFYAVVTKVLHWRRAVAIPLVTLFVLVDGTFFLAGLPKLASGAWIPLAISAAFVTIALTWLEGRRCLAKSLSEQQTPVGDFLAHFRFSGTEPAGTMVFLTNDPTGVPFVAQHGWMRARARDERIILLTLERSARPYVARGHRVVVERLSNRLVRVGASFGFMEQPRITPVLHACAAQGLEIDNDETSFFYADPKIVAAHNGMRAWQRGLFDLLLRISRRLPDDMYIAPHRRIELGVEVAI
jgi:KUP system potassium uptake protein